MPPRIVSTATDDDGLERREYEVDGELVVALVHEGRLVRIEREPAYEDVLAWDVSEGR